MIDELIAELKTLIEKAKHKVEDLTHRQEVLATREADYTNRKTTLTKDRLALDEKEASVMVIENLHAHRKETTALLQSHNEKAEALRLERLDFEKYKSDEKSKIESAWNSVKAQQSSLLSKEKSLDSTIAARVDAIIESHIKKAEALKK